MTQALKLISSMATRQLLTELATVHTQTTGQAIELEAVGGVDAARRVQSGETFDVVVLASAAIRQLSSTARVIDDSVRDLVFSGISVAVRAGCAHPRIESELALRETIQRARAIGYSTGPSGTHLLGLLERWGLRHEMGTRIIQAPPGVPVASLVADGRVELGFQQLSELIGAPGIEVLGPLPPGAQLMTAFTAAVVAGSQQIDAARALISFMASPATRAAKRRQGMEPAE
jgi:molybdate transport system substrate-binding protein